MQFRPTQGSDKIGVTHFARKPGSACLYFQFSAFLAGGVDGSQVARPSMNSELGKLTRLTVACKLTGAGQGRQSAAPLLDRTGREGGRTWGYENSPGAR